MEKILIDTSVFIGMARKQPVAEEAMARTRGAEVLFCDIVLAEILVGAKNQEEYRRTLAHITRAYRILDITPQACVLFREILATKGANDGVHVSDFMIAATAMAHGCPLLTLNRKHFERIKGLVLV